jgi:hypothetical protein
MAYASWTRMRYQITTVQDHDQSPLWDDITPSDQVTATPHHDVYGSYTLFAHTLY